MSREVEMLGQVVELGQNDFPLNKLSDKYGELMYKRHKEGTTNQGKPNEFKHIQVACTGEDGYDVNVKLLLTTENKVALEKFKMKDRIDFEDVIIGFYTGQFDQPTQTIKANKLVSFNGQKQPNK
ncbi:MAG: hypothetical protein ACK5LC_03320 [Coprobacillaceae bacterium]